MENISDLLDVSIQMLCPGRRRHDGHLHYSKILCQWSCSWDGQLKRCVEYIENIVNDVKKTRHIKKDECTYCSRVRITCKKNEKIRRKGDTNVLSIHQHLEDWYDFTEVWSIHCFKLPASTHQ